MVKYYYQIGIKLLLLFVGFSVLTLFVSPFLLLRFNNHR
jgi:hypothetical protein